VEVDERRYECVEMRVGTHQTQTLEVPKERLNRRKRQLVDLEHVRHEGRCVKKHLSEEHANEAVMRLFHSELHPNERRENLGERQRGVETRKLALPPRLRSPP